MSTPSMSGGAQNLGTAQARLAFDVSDLTKLQAATAQAGQAAARNLGQIDTAAKKASSGFKDLSGSFSSLLGAFGVATTGGAILAQFTRMAIQSDAIATAYRRQNVASLELAGSQGKLTALLEEYNKVTGNQIGKAQALADVTRLQAIGFADSTKELNDFTVAARGISLAMGSQQDYVIGQLQLAIANQSTMRLDQIGLGVEEVETRIKKLKEADSSLSTAMAYQNAVLGIATEKYGKLASSLEAQATGAEKASKAWADLQLQFGQAVKSPVDLVMGQLARQLDIAAEGLRSMARDVNYLQQQVSKEAPKNSWLMMLALGTANAMGLTPYLTARGPGPSLEERTLSGNIRTARVDISNANQGLAAARASGNQAEIARMTGIVAEANRQLGQFSAQLAIASGAAGRTAGANNFAQSFAQYRTRTTGYNDDQTKAIRQWSADVQAIEREAGTARAEATRQFEQQRADVIRDYGKSVIREEQDFARNRARAFADYAKQVEDARADAAKREADAAKDYARAVAGVREEAGKREAKWQSDYNEKIAELRSDSNERLVELEADYAKARERAELDHRDRLLSAAARLDAVGVFEEQRNYKRQQADAADNHKEQRDKLTKALDEQLADALKAQQERLQDARAADAERLADMQAAFEEQRQEARQAEAERLADMQEAFDERLKQEDEERAIAAQRRAEDHADQLAQMAAAQADRMAQITEQEANEKKSLEEAFLEQMNSLGIHNEQWLKIQTEQQKASLKLWEEFWKEINKSFAPQGPKTQSESDATAWPKSFATGGWVQRGGLARVHAGEFVVPAAQARSMAGGMSRNVNISEGAIVINAAPGMSEAVLEGVVYRSMMRFLEEAT